MKQLMKGLLLLNLVLFFCFKAEAQSLYANREWVEESPTTGNNYKHTASVVHNGDLIVTGSVFNGSNNVDVFTIKYDGTTGDTLWYATESGIYTGGNDYGVDLIVSTSGDVIVTAAVQNSSTGYDYAVYRYTGSSGAQEWSYTWDGNSGTDIPARIILRDNINSIFIVGGSQASSGGASDFGTIRLDTSGSFIWERFYDGGHNLHDGAVSGSMFFYNQYIATGGASQLPSGEWRMALDLAKVSDGTTYNTFILDTSIVTMVEARAMIIDDQNRIFITGFSEDGDKNIQTIALDSNLVLLWVANFEGSYDDVGEDLGIDSDGNVYVTGYSGQGSGKSKGILIKYSDTGDTLFTKFYGNTVTEDGVKFRKMAVEPNGDSYLTGSSESDGLNSFAFVKFDSDGDLELSRTYQADTLDDDGFDIVVDYNDVYITGFTETIDGTRMTSIKYTLSERDLTVQDDDSLMYVKNNLIVRVHSSLVNTSEVDNEAKEFWTLDEIFTGTLPNDIRNAVEETCDNEDCRITVYKIFKQLKSTDSTTTSRLGETIRIPDFWATFVFEFPYGVDVNEAASDLENVFPSISYSHLNLVGTLDATADDNLYSDQISLFPVNNYSDSAHINLEEAWDYETGKSFVRCGVFDTGILWEHEDFGATKVVGGWDFFTGTSLHTSPDPAPFYHGTKVAGIIGAQRNNGVGIAGVAGGDDDVNETGVSLYSLTILDSSGFVTVLLDYVVEAVIMSSIDDSTLNFGFGLHIANNSWSIKTGSTLFSHNHDLLVEAYHFANRAKVATVASRGNVYNPNMYLTAYPAMLDDDWIINVTSTGTDGHRLDGIETNSATEGSCEAYLGGDIDVGAPGAPGLITTTGSDSPNAYGNFSCTSAAAPHVSGLVALLMSYHNQPIDDYNNLAPEDCEQIIQKTAVDIDNIGYDHLSGWGRIDAGQALKFIADPCHLDHYGTDVSPNTKSYTKVDSMISLYLPKKFEISPGVWILPANFKCNIYRVNATITHPVMSISDTIRAVWPRSSSSTTWGYYKPASSSYDHIVPRERAFVDEYTDSTCDMYGYVYEVFNHTSGTFVGWWPFDLDLSQADLTYSIVRCDTNYITTQIEETVIENSVQVYPNPATHEQLIKIQLAESAEIKVQLYDRTGRLIENVYSGYGYGGEIVVTSRIEHLTSGMYIYRIMIGDEIRHVKFIKQ